ncbi:MAG: SDR family NAD(P)-dependent oxidoreductase [Candidatus Micrarchaeia archaeon]
MERILVTGGSGFIGSHIAEHFVQKGFSVAILDSSKESSNILPFAKDLDIFNCSITDYEEVKKAMKDVRYVFHHAAMVSVPQSVEQPELAKRINTVGTLNVLKAAKECGAKRVILASSSAVYGNNKPPLHENMLPNPLSPYAQTKLENEKHAHESYHRQGLETVSLRYFNVYGPRQNPDSAYAAVIPKFITALKSGSKPVIYGNGSQTRDFIFVKDVVRANVLAASAAKGALGETFNIATGKPVSILSLLEKIASLMGKKADPVLQPPRKGDILHSYADISKASKLLSFNSEYALEKGLGETVKSF